jgi:hypothetical protein
MYLVPFTVRSLHAKTLNLQAMPVDAALGANPSGTGLIARTKGWLRCGLGLLLFAGVLAVCSTGLRGESSPGSTIHLTATLVSPNDVALEWTDTSPDAAGHIVEYATNPSGPFIILHFCPLSQTKYIHPKLMSQTTFYYRVRAFYGPVSNVAESSLPGNLSDETYAKRYAAPEDYSWAGPKSTPDTVPMAKRSVQNAATSAEAAPTDFKAILVPITVSGIQLTWTNHSSDEEGFLLEVKEPDSPDYVVQAVIPAKTNAFGWGFHPPQRKASFRIRAYYYGTPSNLEAKTTLLPQDWKNPAPAAPSKPGN